MRKNWWVALSVILFLINIYLVNELRQMKKHSFLEKNPLIELSNVMGFSTNQSLMTLIIYFSESSCVGCMQESYLWNKLYLDLTREEIVIVGIVPERDDVKKIKKRYEILFPIYQDEKNRFAKRFNISVTPYKILLDIHGNLHYMAQSLSGEDFHKNFYSEVLEQLKRVRLKETKENRGLSISLRKKNILTSKQEHLQFHINFCSLEEL